MSLKRFFFLFLLVPFMAFSNDAPFINLMNTEEHISSQNGEDGVIRTIFSLIGTTNKYYVEFWAGSKIEKNTKLLREKYGWKGLLMDRFDSDPALNLHQENITAANITNLLLKYKVPFEFDLLSIDMDYNDFHIWNGLGHEYRPRVVVIEYNGTHLPNEDKVSLYNPNEFWDGSNYYGGSILAFYKLGKRKGYSLVYADKKGVNLFFIRNDILNNSSIRFLNVNNVEAIYRRPGFGSGPNGGHPKDEKNRPYASSDYLLK